LPSGRRQRASVRCDVGMPTVQSCFMYSVIFLFAGVDSHKHGRPACTVRSRAIVVTDRLLLNEKLGLLIGHKSQGVDSIGEDCTVFLHSCRFRSCPGGDSNDRGRPASAVQSTAIVAPDHRLLHEKCGLLCGRTIAIDGGQHWRKTVLYIQYSTMMQVGRESPSLIDKNKQDSCPNEAAEHGDQNSPH